MTIKYRRLENFFEKTVAVITAVLGNFISFFLATLLVILWLANIDYQNQILNDIVRDYIFGATFLTLFIIQKSFNHFSASLHIKLNELVSSNKYANNAVLNVETKTEHEIKEIIRDYSDLIDQEINLKK